MNHLSIDELSLIFQFLSARDAISFGSTCVSCRSILDNYFWEYWTTKSFLPANFLITAPPIFYKSTYFQIIPRLATTSPHINLIDRIFASSSCDREDESVANIQLHSSCQLIRDELKQRENIEKKTVLSQFDTYQGDFSFQIQLRCGCAGTNACYWSSSSNPDSESIETIALTVKPLISVIVGFSITPYQAFFQPTCPCFAPREIEFLFCSPSISLLRSISPSLFNHSSSSSSQPASLFTPTQIESLLSSVYYHSPRFSVLNESIQQYFYLPQPVMCFGGREYLNSSASDEEKGSTGTIVLVRCLGKQNRQPIEEANDFYCCLSHLSLEGYPLLSQSQAQQHSLSLSEEQKGFWASSLLTTVSSSITSFASSLFHPRSESESSEANLSALNPSIEVPSALPTPSSSEMTITLLRSSLPLPSSSSEIIPSSLFDHPYFSSFPQDLSCSSSSSTSSASSSSSSSSPLCSKNTSSETDHLIVESMFSFPYQSINLLTEWEGLVKEEIEIRSGCRLEILPNNINLNFPHNIPSESQEPSDRTDIESLSLQVSISGPSLALIEKATELLHSLVSVGVESLGTIKTSHALRGSQYLSIFVHDPSIPGDITTWSGGCKIEVECPDSRLDSLKLGGLGSVCYSGSPSQVYHARRIVQDLMRRGVGALHEHRPSSPSSPRSPSTSTSSATSPRSSISPLSSTSPQSPNQGERKKKKTSIPNIVDPHTTRTEAIRVRDKAMREMGTSSTPTTPRSPSLTPPSTDSSTDHSSSSSQSSLILCVDIPSRSQNLLLSLPPPLCVPSIQSTSTSSSSSSSSAKLPSALSKDSYYSAFYNPSRSSSDGFPYSFSPPSPRPPITPAFLHALKSKGVDRFPVLMKESQEKMGKWIQYL